MTPELRTLIYGTIAAVILAALTAAVKFIFDRLSKTKPTAVDRGQAITDLADAMVDVSKKAVDSVRAELVSVRAELDDARQDLAAARLELLNTKRMMETREQDHAVVLDRMHRRIKQLVKVLTDNHLDVPPEEA